MKSIFLSVFLCFVVAGANAQQDNGIEINAPAGFTWGESKQQIESKGIAVRFCWEVKFGLECMVDSAPKEISFVEKYFLLFMEGYGLQKIFMRTDNFTNDPTGFEGKQLYDEVKQILISKYGQPYSRERIGLVLYDEPDEFYRCLAHIACGDWISFWSDEGSIDLEINGFLINGSDKAEGHLSIRYSSKDLSAIYKKKEEAESSKDREAL